MVGISKEIIDPFGNKFRSLAECLRFYKMSDHVYRHRKSRGWSEAKIFSTPVNHHNGVFFCGRKYASQSVICGLVGISPSTVYSRMQKGMTFDQAVRAPVPPKPLYIVRGKKYHSVRELARAFGLKRNTVGGRLERGWDVEMAVTKPVRGRSK